MRTTVTLDADVAAKLKELARRRRASFKVTLNETLRRGLAAAGRPGKPAEKFAVEPHDTGLRRGVDAARLNQLVDELEVEDFRGETGLGSPR